ncbi:MAG: hypothetical protein ABI992_10840 [Chthoniobacterales bacterium]
MFDPVLKRLLDRAAAAPPDPEPEMPYAFDTRVVALARSAGVAAGRENRQAGRWLRRMALAALLVTAVSGSAAYWQLRESEDLNEPTTNLYAIADNAIDADFFQ